MLELDWKFAAIEKKIANEKKILAPLKKKIWRHWKKNFAANEKKNLAAIEKKIWNAAAIKKKIFFEISPAQ